MAQIVEDISATKKRLRIEIPSAEIEKNIRDSLEKLRQKTKIPGFRPGKAPINLIEKRFGKEVQAEVLDRIIPEFFNRALREAELTPVTLPVLEEEVDFRRNNPLNLSITVEVVPKMENLNYENIEIKDVPLTVDDEDIEDSLRRLREEKAVFEVAEKEVEKDDLVIFDFFDCETMEGKSIPAAKEILSQRGNEILPRDIMGKTLGKKKGDLVEFTTTFDESVKEKELIGKTINVKMMIKEIKRKVLPSEDDEFAKDLGFGNLAELKEKLKEKIYEAQKERIKMLQKAEIMNKIVESHDFEVPETPLRNEIESLRLESSMSSSGQERKEGEDPEDELRLKALKKVKASLLIDVIGKKEGVMVTDNEVKDKILFMANKLSARPEAVMNLYISKDGSLEGLRRSIYEDKVLDLLLSKAVIEKGESKENK
ncbi:MAG: trigger factor [Nitrospirota bacterium]